MSAPCLPCTENGSRQSNDNGINHGLPSDVTHSINDGLNKDIRSEDISNDNIHNDNICNDKIRNEGTSNDTTSYLARTLNAIREGASIAGLLRISGAALMVLSLSAFLMQGVEAASDLHRYLLLLGQTLLLSAAGFAVGFWLKEPRGARMFFSLGLISIPANFAVLGAMIYSIAPLDDLITQYPAYASWQSASLKELLVAAAAALTVLVPMSLFCFAVMARQSKWWLTACYLTASATLLIPVRETFTITLISSVCVVALVILLASRKTRQQRKSTGEEKFATALLFIPPLLMLSRSATLYGIDEYLALAMVTGIHYLLRRLVIARTDNKALTTFLQIMAAGTALTLAMLTTALLEGKLDFVGATNPYLLFAIVWLMINVDLVRNFSGTRMTSITHGLWAVVCCIPVLLDLWFIHGFMGFGEALVYALLITSAGVITRHKFIVILGILALAAVLMNSGSHLFTLALDAGWLGMAIAGAGTIVAGSVLERFWPVIRLRITNHFAKGGIGGKAKDAELEHMGIEVQQ